MRPARGGNMLFRESNCLYYRYYTHRPVVINRTLLRGVHMPIPKAILVFVCVVVFCSATLGQIANVQVATPYAALQNEEQVFYSPVDGRFVLATWRDFRLGFRRCGIGRSTDGGATWSDQLNYLLMDPNNRQSDPTMTVDAQGNFHLCFLDYSSEQFMEDSSFVVFIKSTDNGLTWGGPYPVTTDHGPWFEDKQFITADRTGGPHDGNVYVAWARFPNPTRMMFSRSTDGGLTFSDTIIVGPSQEHPPCSYIVDAGQFAQPIVGSDGSVYVFWSGTDLIEGECNGYWAMKMSKSTDGGVTWPILEQPIFTFTYLPQADGGINIYNAAAGDADISGGPYDGNIYISTSYGQADGVLYHSDVVMIKSTDGGLTWLPSVRINDDPFGFDMDQFHPWLVVNQDGVIATIFYDQRLDPNHYKFDVFGAYSFDGGETFTTNHRITEVSSSPDDLEKSMGVSGIPDDLYEGQFDDEGVYHILTPKAGKIAEYIGVTSNHDSITAVWTDARNGNQDVYGASFVIPFMKPRLFGVGDGEFWTGSSDSLFWSTCWHEDNVSYRIEIDDEIGFATPEVVEVVTDNKLYAPSLGLSDDIYYWRVKAFRTIEDDSTDYSAVWSFVVDTGVPSVAISGAPVNDAVITDSMPTFTWSVTGNEKGAAEYFELEVSLDPGFSGTPPYFHYDKIIDNFFTLPVPLPQEGTYYWHVNHYDLAGNESGYFTAESFSFINYVCGDANGDLSVNVADAVFLINYVFKGGAAPDPLDSGDANGDLSVNVADAVFLINYVFKGGVPPCD